MEDINMKSEIISMSPIELMEQILVNQSIIMYFLTGGKRGPMLKINVKELNGLFSEMRNFKLTSVEDSQREDRETKTWEPGKGQA